MDRQGGWAAVFLLGVFWLTVAIVTHGGVFLPGMVVLFAGAALVDQRVAKRLTDWFVDAFSGSALRSALIIGGALLMIQFLPVELALLAAGDFLAYVEAAAAVSLIAANTRLKPLVRAMRVRVETVVARLRPLASGRQAGTRPAVRRKAPPADSEGQGWAFA
ncbi:hypothetical protein [Brevundimonas sp. FT23042]|uniref:hypothetical protein n=1 Tax=Brevundimonas sp. FT23042 TaxID=3393749 RepID=UPI003B588E21